MKPLVIIPTYNEIENIPGLIPSVLDVLPPEAAVLVVDDGSPDGTAMAVRKMQENFGQRLFLLERTQKRGLSDAYRSGFKWGMENGFDVLCEMDADFSHNPAYLPAMLEEIKKYDFVIGSRNIKGGSVEGWTVLRKLVSKGGSLYSRLVLRCPIKDLTGGFNIWKKETLGKIGLDSIIAKGYSFQIEMKYKAYRAGCSVKEIPIVFPDRTAGKSKMSIGIFMEAITAIWRIRNAR